MNTPSSVQNITVNSIKTVCHTARTVTLSYCPDQWFQMQDQWTFPFVRFLIFSTIFIEFSEYRCWRMFIPCVHFRENVETYCLHIAEDDGEVDTDFPSLDSKEPVSKFGFTKLALVEKDMPSQANKTAIIVTV